MNLKKICAIAFVVVFAAFTINITPNFAKNGGKTPTIQLGATKASAEVNPWDSPVKMTLNEVNPWD